MVDAGRGHPMRVMDSPRGAGTMSADDSEIRVRRVRRGERDRSWTGRGTSRPEATAAPGRSSVSADAVRESGWADDAGVVLSEARPAAPAPRGRPERADRADRRRGAGAA